MEMYTLKKIFFVLFCAYKMVEITKETLQKNGVEVIVSNG